MNPCLLMEWTVARQMVPAPIETGQAISHTRLYVLCPTPY
jgi:hypothetical protein